MLSFFETQCIHSPHQTCFMGVFFLLFFLTKMIRKYKIEKTHSPFKCSLKDAVASHHKFLYGPENVLRSLLPIEEKLCEPQICGNRNRFEALLN